LIYCNFNIFYYILQGPRIMLKIICIVIFLSDSLLFDEKDMFQY